MAKEWNIRLTHVTHASCASSIPTLPKVRGKFAEFLDLTSPNTPSPFQRGAPVTVLGTDMKDPFRFPFHGLQE